MNKEVQIIKKLIEGVQGTAIWYISLLKETDPKTIFQLNGRALNSLYWIVGHLAWAEDMLVIRAAGNEGFLAKYGWLEQFQLGAKHVVDGPDYAELKAVAKEIHAAAMQQLDTMTDEELNNPNTMGLNMFGADDVRGMLYHHIRHLGTHAGQLGWLCKLQGIQTV